MESAIGRRLRDRHRQQVTAVVIGVMTVVLDLLMVAVGLDDSIRCALGIVALALFVWVTDGDLPSVGLQLTPNQGWLRWGKLSLVIAIVVGVLVGVGFALWKLSGIAIPIHTTPPDSVLTRGLAMCFVAPVMEETIYRLAVCVPLAPLIGCWKTIGVSGLLFAALHVVYGNPSPENLIGGFFLAWVYLASESLLMPVLLHSVGNLFALASQIAGWYYLNSPT